MNNDNVVSIHIYPYQGDGFPVYINQFEGRIKVKKGDLEWYNSTLRKLAWEIVDKFDDDSGNVVEPEEEPGILERLIDKGNWVFSEIFLDNDTRATLTALLGASDVDTIHIFATDFALPWELLCSDKKGALSIEDLWGWKYAIWRQMPLRAACSLPDPAMLEAVPDLVLGLFAGSGLEYVAKETEFFHDLQQRGIVKLDSYKCSTRTREESLRKLTKMCQQNSHIIHFACHAEQNADHIEETCLELSDLLCLSIEDLRNIRFRSWPFVFLNACGTGWRDATHSFHFVQRFLWANSRGLVATESDIPDKFAAQFAIEFYKKFLGIDCKPQTLGEALLSTRRSFMKDKDNPNPLALLYSLYGDPRLQIRR